MIVTILLLSSCKNTESSFKDVSDISITETEYLMLKNADSLMFQETIISDNVIYVLKRNDTGEISGILERHDKTGDLGTVAVLFLGLIILLIIALLALLNID